MDPVTAGLGLVDTFVNKFVKDKDLAAKLKAQAKSEEFAGELSLLVGQLEINKAEASHASVFVSGWRPLRLGMRNGVIVFIYPFTFFRHLARCSKVGDGRFDDGIVGYAGSWRSADP